MQQATYFSSPEGYGTHAEANELPGMVVLTTKESLDVVWVLISSLSQETWCVSLSRRNQIRAHINADRLLYLTAITCR